MAHPQRELFIPIRAALVNTLKGVTEAGNQVRTGVKIPLTDPFSVNLPATDQLPLIIVGSPDINFPLSGVSGRRKIHRRDCQFQIDAWLLHSRSNAVGLGITIDEELEQRRDLIIDQIITEIEDKDFFYTETSVEKLAEMWLVSVTNNNYETAEQAIIATASITINVRYDLMRLPGATENLNKIFIKNKIDSIEKDVEVDRLP